ncbi:hypothetical protein MHYP_G00309600 [Metynnis hypsauchen]
MATKGAQAAEDRSSSDSDDSMSGRPNFSAEERGLSDDLLKNSNEFIRLYEDHQPELQQIIKDLEKSSDEFLCKYDEATRQSRTGRKTAAVGAGVGVGLGLALAPLSFAISLLVGAAVAGAAATPGTIYSLKGNINKKEEGEKALEDVKKALQTFNTTVETVTKHLHNVCNQVEKILQYQKDEQSRLLKSELGSLGAVVDFITVSGHQVLAGMTQHGLVLLTAAFALISAAVGFNTHLQQVMKNPLVENISQPYEEFCSSGRCTYLVPSAFLKHLNNEQCEAAWHAPDEGSLADPSHPTSLKYPAVEVTPESLVTKKHVDGLWIDIRCHDAKANLRQYQAVFRAVTETNLPLKNSAQPRNPTVSCLMLSAGGAVLVLVVLVLCVI